MRQISVTYDETDISKALEQVITHSNKAEIVKLITPMICSSSSAVDYFFKSILGNELPKVFPEGSICKCHVNNLSYGSNKDLVREKFADADGKIVVTVKEFRGYHEYSNYWVSYTNVYPDGSTKKETSHCSFAELELLSELDVIDDMESN
jgi:hypothetical protein